MLKQTNGKAHPTKIKKSEYSCKHQDPTYYNGPENVGDSRKHPNTLENRSLSEKQFLDLFCLTIVIQLLNNNKTYILTRTNEKLFL